MFNLADLQTKGIVTIPMDQIYDNPDNPPNLEEPANIEKIISLAKSITEEGLNNPILVVARPEGGYKIIAGHSRRAATRDYLHWTEIDCYIQSYDNEAYEYRALARDNLLQKDKDPITVCKYIEKYIEKTLPITRKEPDNVGVATKLIIAKDLGIGATTVQQYLSILNAEKTVKEAFYEGKMNASVAYKVAVSKIDDIEKKQVVKRIEKKKDLTSKDVEILLKRENKKEKQALLKDYEPLKLALTRRLDTKVVIKNKKVEICFENVHDLNRILRELGLETVVDDYA
ncbi:MAG: ParB/RepB/Spo0J family partition protein [Coprobacillaceae bacterium]